MSKTASKLQLILAAFVLLAALGASAAAVAQPEPLSGAERDGFLQWLHSLETAVAAREEAELPEAAPLYPFDTPAWDLSDPRPYRHLSISKAVTELEAEVNARGGAGRVGGNLSSTLMALANARNYVNLSEYDSALVWYRVAAEIDSTGSFRHEIAREGLACAASANDSLAMAALMTNTLGTDDLTGRQDELVLAYRWLLTARDTDSVEHLVDKIEAHREVVTPRLRFWHAYALGWLGRPSASLAELRVLVRDGGLSHGLSEHQRGWVLSALADDYFLLGDSDTARGLYRALADCAVGRLRMWGKNQLAGLDFIEHRYLSAGAGFEEVCEGTRFGAWQDQACAMVEIAREMERIKGEGEPYGVAQFYRP
ncbi:hypothetical protein KDM41_07445 [bacterium]|nr:hypothetical protein [bacterium]